MGWLNYGPRLCFLPATSLALLYTAANRGKGCADVVRCWLIRRHWARLPGIGFLVCWLGTENPSKGGCDGLGSDPWTR